VLHTGCLCLHNDLLNIHAKLLRWDVVVPVRQEVRCAATYQNQ
jgi:hypothetical protein